MIGDNDYRQLVAGIFGAGAMAKALAALTPEEREVIAVQADGLAGANVRFTMALGEVIAIPHPLIENETPQLARAVTLTSMLTEFLLQVADSARYGEKA